MIEYQEEEYTIITHRTFRKNNIPNWHKKIFPVLEELLEQNADISYTIGMSIHCGLSGEIFGMNYDFRLIFERLYEAFYYKKRLSAEYKSDFEKYNNLKIYKKGQVPKHIVQSFGKNQYDVFKTFIVKYTLEIM